MSNRTKSEDSHSGDGREPDHKSVERRLRSRLSELHEDACAELIAEDEERYLDVIGSIGEWARGPIAARLHELDLEPVNRHLPEIDEIEGALQRIEAGGYGLCLDCGAAIESDLLTAYPTVARCASCGASA